MNSHYETLEFPVILEQLQNLAVAESAREILGTLEPIPDEQACVQRMAETTAARRVLDAFGAPPLPMMTGLSESLTHAE
ncbi:MAG TPA: DNA mismatch repair protein MutS, partial [Candidatus Limiplasma sp.]|nr:DNA mismatch repair protein MutS [Candidatus Limiplasma sp.]